MIVARHLLDGTMPEKPGDYSRWKDFYRPPHGKRDEIFMMVPTGQIGVLIPEHHTWTWNENGEITVVPSIVYFNYHGFLKDGVWS